MYSRPVSRPAIVPPPPPDSPPDGTPPDGPPERSESQSFRVPVDVRSVSLFVLATVASIFMLKYMEDVLVPIVLGALIFYALSPAVEWMVRHYIPRVIAAIIMMLALVGGLGGAAYGLSDEATAVVQGMPQTVEKLRQSIRGFRRQNNDSLTQVQKAATALEQTATEAVGGNMAPRGVMRVQIVQPGFRLSEFLMSGAQNALIVIGQSATVLFLTFFMLLSSARLKTIAVEVTGPTLSKKKITVQILDEIAGQVQHFLLILLLTGVIVGVATSLALWAFGLQYPVLWGLAAGVLNSVPYFGPVVVGFGLGAVALVQFGTLTQALMVAGAAVLITSLEGFILTPFLQGKAAKMNSVAVFVGILFWSWMWGPIGLLLAVPLTTVVKVVCDHVEQLQPVGQLLGE
jgi:predicted PurR-regulated permease PerM